MKLVGRARWRRAFFTSASTIILATLSLSVLGCSPQDSGQKPVRVLCSAAQGVCKAWAADFSAQSQIPVQMVRLPTGEALTRLAAFAHNPEFDIWHGGPSFSYVNAKDQGLLQAYNAPERANIPSEYRDKENYWTGVYVGVLSFCVNTQVTSRLGIPVAQDWGDLVDKRLRGQISMSSPVSSGTAFTALWTQVLRLGSQDLAFDYLRKLHANVLQYTMSGVAPANVAGRGEVAVGLVFAPHCQRSIDAGMKWLRIVYPASGTGYEVGGVAVVAGAPNVAGARAYVDYALSVRSQEQGYKVGIPQLPTNVKSASTAQLRSLSQRLIAIDPVQGAHEQDAILQRFIKTILPARHG